MADPWVFLERLQTRLAQEGAGEFDWGATPRLRFVHRGRRAAVEFDTEDLLLLDLEGSPPCQLRLSPEDAVSRALDRVGLSPEVKIGVPDFDDSYKIQHISAEDAARFLNDEIRAHIRRLEPFVRLEWMEQGYRLSRRLTPSYGPQQVLEDLAALEALRQALEALAR